MLKSIKAGKKPGKILLLSVLLISVLASSASAATNISECGDTIISEGEYVLNQSLMTSSGADCLTIGANNVIIDGAGYTITGASDISIFDFGVKVWDKTNVSVKNLTVTGFSYAIHYSNSPYGDITNINTTNNSYGIIFYENSNYHYLTNSYVTSNKIYGFYVENSISNIIYNNIFNNTNNIFYSGSTDNSWNLTTKQLGTNIVGGPYLGGNFWSDYSGVDGDGDGLGDTPYPINITDYLPLLIPTYLPPSPAGISSSQGNFWINYTWSSGLGNVTDSYNVSVNGAWNNGSAVTYNNSTPGAHGWSNISVYAFNNSGTGSLNPVPLTSETQLNNNAPVQAGISDKTVTAGNWLNFTVSATDADSDTITYGTNATKGLIDSSTGEFTWSTNSSDVGTYIWEFNSSDIYGGIDTEIITVTVNAAIVTTTTTNGGSSGDGGIGGGVVSAEPYDNIDRSDMSEKYLVLNNPVLFTFKFPELSIYEIAVTGKDTEKYAALKVEALKGATKNPGISAFSGTVYKNVNIWASSNNIKDGQIRFKVENTWIANAGNDLRMVKWDGSKWVDLVTSELRKDDTYTFYEANTDSFGSFAITAMEAEVVPAQVVEENKVDLIPVKLSSTPVPAKAPGFEAIIAVFAIAMIVALLKNNRQRR